MYILLVTYLSAGFISNNWNMNWNQEGTLLSFAYSMTELPDWNIFVKQFSNIYILSLFYLKLALGFLSVGMITNYLKIVFKNNILVFVLFMPLLILEGLFGNYLKIYLSFIPINLSNWIRPITILYDSLFLIFVSCAFYFLGKGAIKKADFIKEGLETDEK